MREDLTMNAVRPRRWPRIIAWALPAVLLAGGGGYVAVAATAPLPEPTTNSTAPAAQTFELDDASVGLAVDAQALPSAVGWLDGTEVWANDDAPYPLASITKLVTALVGQEVAPLAVDESGPIYSWSDADTELQAELEELDGIAFPIPVGTEVTRRQMLTLALIPSANDFATAYAHSIFGDNAGFVAAVDDWAARHGIDSLTVREPSGMDDGNSASAADVVRIARLALADPALAEIVGTQSATLPWGIGEVVSTNPLLGTMTDAIGVKTGRTETAGYSLAAAARSAYSDREITRIAVVFGRASSEERAHDARLLLTQMAELPERLTITTAGERLGTLTSVDGQQLELTAADSTDAVLVPGEEASRTLNIDTDSIAVESPQGSSKVAIHSDGSFTEPSLWWRITHPRELFAG